MGYTMAQIAAMLGVEVQTANKYRRKAETKYGEKFGTEDSIDGRKTYYTENEFEKISEFAPRKPVIIPELMDEQTTMIVHSPKGFFEPTKLELPTPIQTDLSHRKQNIEATNQVNNYAIQQLREHVRQLADGIVDNVETTFKEFETYLINDGIAEIGKKMSESKKNQS